MKTMKKQQKSTGKATIISVVYEENTFNGAVNGALSHAQEFKTYVEQTAAIMGELPGTFGSTLAYHMDKLHLTNEALASRCLINEDTIRRYRNGSSRSKPTLQTVVALCVGLKLPAPLSFDLVHKAGYIFAGEHSDIAYQTILCSMTRCSIYDCNKLLRSAGVPPLVKEK